MYRFRMKSNILERYWTFTQDHPNNVRDKWGVGLKVSTATMDRDHQSAIKLYERRIPVYVERRDGTVVECYFKERPFLSQRGDWGWISAAILPNPRQEPEWHRIPGTSLAEFEYPAGQEWRYAPKRQRIDIDGQAYRILGEPQFSTRNHRGKTKRGSEFMTVELDV